MPEGKHKLKLNHLVNQLLKKELGGESEPYHVGSLDTLSPSVILLTINERGAFVIPVFWMRKTRLREDRSLAQGP